ncbi:uncharacterized protein DS421_10g292000 [Arachis hypogaea]|nr:uncharacterized protein DS421_10g292000 [Arachis hypogaea]
MFSVIEKNRNKNRTMNIIMPAYMNRGGRKSITGELGEVESWATTVEVGSWATAMEERCDGDEWLWPVGG